MPYDDIINSHTAGWRNRRKPWCNLTVSVMFSSTTKSVRRSSDYLTTILRVDPAGSGRWQLGRKCSVLKEGTQGPLGRGWGCGNSPGLLLLVSAVSKWNIRRCQSQEARQPVLAPPLTHGDTPALPLPGPPLLLGKVSEWLESTGTKALCRPFSEAGALIAPTQIKCTMLTPRSSCSNKVRVFPPLEWSAWFWSG